MSRENVDVVEPVRRLWAALNERDWDAFSAVLDPEVEYMPREEHAPYRGPEAVVQYASRWLEAWDPFSGEVEEVESAPAEDRALVGLRLRGKGKGSEVEIDDLLFWVCELRGGRLFRISEHSDRAEARKAAS